MPLFDKHYRSPRTKYLNLKEIKYTSTNSYNYMIWTYISKAKCNFNSAPISGQYVAEQGGIDIFVVGYDAGIHLRLVSPAIWVLKQTRNW